MAQRLSEQVVEWLTVGGDAFTPQNFNSTNGNIPLVISKPGESVTIPATNGTAIGVYNNKGQLWTVGAAGATTSVKSSQLIVSSSDAAAGAGAALELWRGTDVSWQLLASNSDDLLYIGNNWTTAAQTSYAANVAFGYGAAANQYVHIYSTLDSNYANAASGSALSIAGGLTAGKKVYFADTTDSNYATKAGALVVEGGANIAKKVYLRDTTDSNYATVAGSFVTMGGAYIKKKTYIADATDSNYATKAGSLVTEGGAYIAKKTYIASTTDSNYSTKAGSLVTEGGIYSAKKVYIADATDSNYSTLAGALVVAGGANFGKKVYLKDATDSTSYTTGSLVTAGGAAITKQLRVQGVTTHGGNVLSDTNATDDIGATATRWKNGYFSTSVNVGAASTTYSTSDGKNAYLGPGVIYVNTNATGASYGYELYGHGTVYGRMWIYAFGTANVPATEEGGTGTAGAAGEAYLTLGNSTAVKTDASYGTSVSGADNALGVLRLYGSNTKYADIRSHTTTGNTVYYLPKLYTSGTSTYYGKLVGIYKSSTSGDSGFNDVGSGVIPVYVTADGKVTASTSTVGSGTKPIYLSSGTLTVSSSTVGSGVKPVYLSSGEIKVSSSSVGGTAQPVYLSSGEIKGISATVGSATGAPVYLNAGTITVMTDISLTRSNTTATYVNVGNSNGAVELLASTNRGVYDTTNSKWIVYTAQAADHTYIPLWASKGSATNPVYFNSSGEPVATTYSLSATINAGTANCLAYYSGANAISKVTNITTNGTSITLAGEGAIVAKIARKKSGGGGWAYSGFTYIGNDDATFAQMGVYGTADALSYVYLGANGYNGNNLRIDTSGNVTAQGGLLKSTANSNTVSIGSQNANFCHIYNSASIPFIFNNSILTTKGATIGQTGQYRPYQLYLGYNTTSDSSALDSANPLIEFANSARSQYAQIVYTDFNNQGGTDSINFVSNQSDLRVKGPIFQASKCFVTANHGTGVPGSSTPGNGITGAVYFRRV